MKSTLNIRGNLMSLERPAVMGIVNVTPDSFYENSRVQTTDHILKKVERMLLEGADFIDVGGYSSRPGASEVSIDEELKRTVQVVVKIKTQFPKAVVSIDTFRSAVARECVAHGADLINDISGGQLDQKMFATVRELKVPYILMHMKGSPQTMRYETSYENLLLEIVKYFQIKVSQLYKMGINDIIIDPGFGFAKTIDQNYQLLRSMDYFKILELPLLVGVSRKSMIYKPLNVSAQKSLNGTTALHMVALQKGASILRVHDVKEAMETVKLFNLTFEN